MMHNSGKKTEKIDSIKEDKSFQILKLAIEEVKEKYKLASNEILSLIEEKPISKAREFIARFGDGKLKQFDEWVKLFKETE